MRHGKTRFTPRRERRLVVFRTFRDLPLLDVEPLKDDFIEQIRKAQRATGFHLYGWLILPDEVWLILSSTAKQSIRDIVDEMKGRFASRMLRRFGEQRPELLEQLRDKRGEAHFWHTGGGSDTIVRDGDHLRELLADLYEEPVRRGLAESAPAWKWSSARWHAGQRAAGDLPVERWE